MTADDYFLRTERMMKLKDDMNFSLGKEDDRKIVDAVLRFELLMTKLSQPVKLSNQTDRIKGAVYIMYNFVRLKAILNQFESNVTSGIYPPVPPFHQIDFQQLACEEEWHIMFCYLFDWPQVVRTACESLSSKCHIHTIFMFLAKLSTNFSSYYAKERILTENREQLLPVMFARICLMKAIVRVMENAFTIVGISPLSRM
ncbi:DALR anticodon-binding domain-containing protein 3 [Nilaparvata lugens]|uniref:DALR anticodon-binding domain-containing protein 3 n=2 Tax=Nilaparvata lugens TaxID=108931 RepID=UPI00193DA8EA|nr:DALR anticodon-binding domain-containing protein 3 [Nilaparvata lugens]